MQRWSWVRQKRLQKGPSSLDSLSSLSPSTLVSKHAGPDLKWTSQAAVTICKPEATRWLLRQLKTHKQSAMAPEPLLHIRTCNTVLVLSL